jgi:hypothetical protein
MKKIYTIDYSHNSRGYELKILTLENAVTVNLMVIHF